MEGYDVGIVVGCAQAHVVALVGAAGVVVVDVFAEDRAQVTFSGDEQPVGAFGSGRVLDQHRQKRATGHSRGFKRRPES